VALQRGISRYERSLEEVIFSMLVKIMKKMAKWTNREIDDN
jgi:hypothetical protein